MARGRCCARRDAPTTEPCRLAYSSRVALLCGTARRRIFLCLAGIATQTQHLGFNRSVHVPAARMDRNSCAGWTARRLLTINSTRRLGNRHLVSPRGAQRIQIHRHGLGISIAKPERRHSRLRLHGLRISHPAIGPGSVQSKAGSIERWPDLATLSPDAVAAIAAVFVGIEPLTNFR